MQNQQESVSDPAARVVTSPWFTPGTPPFSGPTYILGRKETIHDVVGIPPEKPISLYSLPDPRPGEKPDYTYATLVKIAIWESPAKKLTLQEIYDALEARFLWFKSCNNPNSWKTSIRHSLSLLSAFQKVPRNESEPGKGVYWTVDFTKGEGNKRPRKRNKKLKPDASGEQSSTISSQEGEEETRSEFNPGDFMQGGSLDSDYFIDPALREPNSPYRSGMPSTQTTPRFTRTAPYPSSPSSVNTSPSPFGNIPEASGSSSYGDESEFGVVAFGIQSMGQGAYDASSDLGIPLAEPELHNSLHQSYQDTDIFSGEPLNLSSDLSSESRI